MASLNKISIQEHQLYLAYRRNIFVLWWNYRMIALSYVHGLLFHSKALLKGFCSYFISIKESMQFTGRDSLMKGSDRSVSEAQ